MENKSSSLAKSLSYIPKTGRIGRFAKILQKEVNEDILFKIIQDSDKYSSLKPEKKALWWKNSVEKMENELGKVKSVKIMSSCGEKCCGKGQRKTAKKLMDASKSVRCLNDV
jgi:phage antirepressor YoqD-like protein